MTDVPYARIHGVDFTAEADADSPPDSSGGGRKTEDYSLPGWGRSEVQDAGREPARYSGIISSPAMQNIKDIIAEFNLAPTDCEFCPFDADHCVYAASASARYSHPLIYSQGTKNYYHGSFEVISREPALFGIRQGLTFDTNVSLPATSTTLTNEGTEANTIDYVALSGGYNPLIGYTDDLKLTIHAQETALCDRLMRNDLFEVSRWGEVRHSYQIDWTRCYESLQIDLWGSDFCFGGSIAANVATFASGQIIFPFAGPLPISESPPPRLEFYLESGSPTIWRAFTRDLSDLAVIDADVQRGYNTIEIPECDGQSFVAFGLVGNFTISDISATVQRYLADCELPTIEVGDEFEISVSDGEYSNHILNSLIAVYRDKYWW